MRFLRDCFRKAKAPAILEEHISHGLGALTASPQKSCAGRIDELSRVADCGLSRFHCLLCSYSLVSRMNPEPSPKKRSSDEEAQRFYEILEKNGQLVNITGEDDIRSLPPHVTHVRHPDGRVERIGFSSLY